MEQDAFVPTEAERARIRRLSKRFRRIITDYPDLNAPLPLKLSIAETTILLAHLKSRADRSWKDRTVAAWVSGVSDLSISQRDEAIASLRHLLRNRRKIKPALIVERVLAAYAKTVPFVLPVAFFTSMMIRSISICFGDAEDMCPPSTVEVIIGGTILSGVFAFMAFPVALPILIARAKARNNEARAMTAKSLLRQNAVEAMPELLEGAFDKSEAVRKECQVALRHFLPQITETNLDAMPINSEELIAKILDNTSDFALCEAIVDYLEKFGQGSSAKAICGLIDRLTHTLTRIFPFTNSASPLDQFLAKCERVLALLEERQNQDNARQELLRHSNAPVVHADELLRPAADSQTTPAELLLRASHSHLTP